MSTTHPINWKQCLSNCNQKESLAHEILALFATDLKQLKNDILNAHQSNNKDDLQHYVHKLHGACAYCCATSLEQQAGTLEMALASKSSQHYSSLVQSIVKEIEDLIVVLQKKDYVTF